MQIEIDEGKEMVGCIRGINKALRRIVNWQGNAADNVERATLNTVMRIFHKEVNEYVD